MAFMSKKELTVAAGLSAVMVGLLLYIWPYPTSPGTGEAGYGAFQDLMQRQQAGKRRPGPAMSAAGRPLLAEMEKAAREMVAKFGPVRNAVLEAVVKGELAEAKPYAGEVPVPADVTIVHMRLVSKNLEAGDRARGYTRLWVEGFESFNLAAGDGQAPDYDLLASVLAAMRIRRQADSGGSMTVELAPMAFVPFESVRSAAEAAARAGVTDIILREPPIPY